MNSAFPIQDCILSAFGFVKISFSKQLIQVICLHVDAVSQHRVSIFQSQTFSVEIAPFV